MNQSQTRYRWVMLAGVWLLYFSFGLAVTSLAPLVEYIRADLNITYTAMGLILGIWQFVYIGSAIPCGVLLDKLGAQYALLLGALIITLSLLARAFATDFYSMMAAVMIFGVGGPIISAGAPKVVTGLFSGSDRGLAMGIYMTGPAIGGIISLTLTHSVLLPTMDQDWRNIMLLWAGVSGLFALVWLFISSQQKAAPAIQTSNSPPLGQLQVFRLIAKEPAVVIVLFMSVGVFLINHGLNNWLPELLRSGGMSYTEAGYWAALPTIVGIVGSLLIPRLATPEKRFNILIGLCVCAAGASFLLQFQETSLMFSGLFLQGIARSALMTILNLTLVELPAIGERYAGVASGFFFSAAEVGGVLGPVTMGLFFDYTGGFTASLYFLTVVAVLTGLGAVRLKRLAKPV
jgi:CP family cyanate transporter-like MFS transporter